MSCVWEEYVTEFKLIWTTDWHLADSPPINRIDDYTDTCFKKIDQIKKLCEVSKADLCLIGGDIFHVKTSSKVRHALVSRTIQELQKFPCPIYTIVGNHDISHNNIVTLPEKPIGVLFNSGVLQKLDEKIITKDDLKIRILGRHFDPCITLDSFDTLQKDDEDWFLICYHGYASMHGVSYPGEVTFKYRDLAKLVPDDWYLGHWHIDQGISHIENKYFVNIGSLTRGALNLENITRTPKAVLATYTKYDRKLQQIRLKMADADDVFDLRKKERIDREQALINQFIEKLKEEADAPTKDNDIGQKISALNLEGEVKQKVISLLEEAEDDLRASRSGVH